MAQRIGGGWGGLAQAGLVGERTGRGWDSREDPLGRGGFASPHPVQVWIKHSLSVSSTDSAGMSHVRTRDSNTLGPGGDAGKGLEGSLMPASR
jgi:hypothetical protein